MGNKISRRRSYNTARNLIGIQYMIEDTWCIVEENKSNKKKVRSFLSLVTI